MQWWDLLLTVAIVAIAAWYLYRKFVVDKGCSGCSSSCSTGNTGQNSVKENNSRGCDCNENRQ